MITRSQQSFQCKIKSNTITPSHRSIALVSSLTSGFRIAGPLSSCNSNHRSWSKYSTQQSTSKQFLKLPYNTRNISQRTNDQSQKRSISFLQHKIFQHNSVKKDISLSSKPISRFPISFPKHNTKANSHTFYKSASRTFSALSRKPTLFITRPSQTHSLAWRVHLPQRPLFSLSLPRPLFVQNSTINLSKGFKFSLSRSSHFSLIFERQSPYLSSSPITSKGAIFWLLCAIFLVSALTTGEAQGNIAKYEEEENGSDDDDNDESDYYESEYDEDDMPSDYQDAMEKFDAEEERDELDVQKVDQRMSARRLNHLIELGFLNPIQPDKFGWTLFHEACLWGRDDLVEVIIASGAPINIIDEAGLAPLHIAATAGNFFLVQLLLDNGANPNLPDNNGLTPLMHAVNYGNPMIVMALTSSGGNPYQQDNHGANCFDIARHTYKQLQLMLGKKD